jgi:hypothetical protein
MALGLFTAHVDAGDEPAWEPGPDRVAAEHAVEWARSRAAKVIVRCCESWENTFYSAGDQQAFGEHGPLPIWPDGGLDLKPRRLPGWEHLDRTSSDEAIDWEVLAGGDVFPQPEAFGEPFEAALRSGEPVVVRSVAISEPHVEGSAFYLSGDTLRAHLVVTARTLEEATSIAAAACSEAVISALEATSSTPSDHIVPEWQVAAYPVGSKAAEVNVRRDTAD